MALAPTAHAQPDAEDEPPPKVIEIRPRAAPVPALKYRLLPERRELIAGNAAIFYHRAIEIWQNDQIAQLTQALATKQSSSDVRSADELAHAWNSGPLREIPLDKARAHLARFAHVLREVELGARRESCDWEFDHRDEGFELLLPEIQATRILARLVVLKIRVELREGRPDEAIRWLQAGFALSRHVTRGTTLIQSLVGAAIAGVMTDALEELIQAPGAPNLVWALAGLPRPFIDLTPALEGERTMLERQLPRLKELDGPPWSLEQARSFSADLQRDLAKLTGMWAPVEGGASLGMKDWGTQLGFTAMVARSYPEAKRSLIAEGRPAAEVEAMPAIQAVGLLSLRKYRELRDELFKWANSPYARGQKGMEEADRRISSHWRESGQGLPFSMILPGIRSAFAVPVRIDRRLDALQAIEAIRMYASENGGELPESLDAIADAPILLDPGTGTPFAYTHESGADTATLSAPLLPGDSPGPRSMIRYEMKLAR